MAGETGVRLEPDRAAPDSIMTACSSSEPAHVPVRQALLDIFESVTADIAAANPVCELSGRCCRFKEYGHTLFISRTEAELLLEPGLPPGSIVDEATCPFQIGGLCTARERRPLGCRIYFCDPKYAGKGEELSERYIARLKHAHEASATPWEYRPLHVFLREINPPVPSVASNSVAMET